MKKNLSTIIAVITCAAVGVCIFQNVSLKRKLSDMERNLSSQMSNVDAGISDIYANIDSHLAKQDNLLAVREQFYDVLDMDVDKKTVTVRYTIVPKEYKENVTTAVLVCNDTEYPMTFEDGKFAAEVLLPLFEESRISEVRFAEDDTVRVQGLDWYISPDYDLFPNVYVNGFSVDPVTTEKKDSMIICEFGGEFEIQLEQKNAHPEVQSVYLLPYIDGEEQKKIQLPINTTSEWAPNNEEHAEEVWDGAAERIPGQFYCVVDETFKVPYSSTLDLYIEVVDENGLRYRAAAYCLEVDRTGNFSGTGSAGEAAGIYSEDGKRLY